MAMEDANPQTPIASKPSPNPNTDQLHVSQAGNSSHPNNNNEDKNNYATNHPSPNNPQKAEEFILSVASNIACQPLQYSDPDVWAVLTAISDKARKRRQGLNMILTSDEHRIGRLVDDARFQILSNQISAQHCKIYRQRVSTGDVENSSKFCTSIFLKDTSTNGTYLNWEKLNKKSPESKLHHGDIISFAAPPQHELAYAFVFREVLKSTSLSDGSPLKRKADESMGKLMVIDMLERENVDVLKLNTKRGTETLVVYIKNPTASLLYTHGDTADLGQMYRFLSELSVHLRVN